MDFMNRGFRNGQPTQTVDQTTNPAGPAPQAPVKGKSNSGKKLTPNNLGNAAKFGFLLLIVALVVLALVSLMTYKGGTTEAKLVDETKYQAVFLNGGQVYFGKVADLNNKYVEVNNVYYLRVNQQVQPDANAQNAPNDISLVKLGCELHGPTDQMVINREQVIFWENLKDDGQVTKAIKQYQEQYPNGQNCDEQAATQNSGGATEQQSTTPTTTTPAPATNNEQ